MSTVHDTLRMTTQRASARAWGIATGLVLGLGLLGATWWLVLRGGENVGTHLGRLAHIFPGYDISWSGGVLGFLYAFVVGYALARLLAPRAPISHAQSEAELQMHARLNARSWSLALGGLLAAGLFVVTTALLLRGGEHPGDLLKHLDTFFLGYAITWPGAFLGALWCFATGWLAGQLLARVYNRAVASAERAVARG
ncbi:MAG: hypothetical protein FJ294_11415 [Planctomycetes bacterium]|nr:hypothetical protein [Planctomycetota bacterium]